MSGKWRVTRIDYPPKPWASWLDVPNWPWCEEMTLHPTHAEAIDAVCAALREEAGR